jgi:uncharacterized protein YbjT (DUF2867 family)
MTQTILVTGATGTVGSFVVESLVDREARIRVATRGTDTAGEYLNEGNTHIAFDFTRPETWGDALTDADRLFLVRPPVVGGARIRGFVDAAARVGVEHVVYLSILGANRNPWLPHRRIERHIEATDIAYTFLRASFFMQNLSEIHRPEIVDHGEIVVPAGSGKTSFVDTRDVAAAAAVALTEDGHENRSYDITGPEALNYNEVARIFTDGLNRSISYANPSMLTFVCRMRARGHSLPFVAVMLGIYTTVRLGFSARVSEDAEALLERRPINTRQFVADYAHLFR